MCSRSGTGFGLARSLRRWGHLPGLRQRVQRCTEVRAQTWSACFMACPELGSGRLGSASWVRKWGHLRQSRVMAQRRARMADGGFRSRWSLAA